MFRRRRFAATLTGGWRRLWRALGSNVITTTLCALMGILHADTERPKTEETPTSFERQIDNVGEIEKHRITRRFWKRLEVLHTAFLNTRRDVLASKAEKEKITQKADNAESTYEGDLQECRSNSGKTKISPKNEKRLLVIMAILETIVISIAFYALCSDPFSLIAMGALPGMLVVIGAHFNGALLRSIIKMTEVQDAKTTKQPIIPAKKGVVMGLLVALVITNVLFVLAVSWFRAYATVYTADLVDHSIWTGPLPGVNAFTFFFAIISTLTFVVGTIASWFANQPDVIRSHRQLKLSTKIHKGWQRELKRIKAVCERADKAHNAAHTALKNAYAVLASEVDENLADTITRINIYRNANETARTDNIEPFHNVEIVHQPINEEPIKEVDLGQPIDTTLSDGGSGLDEELGRLLDN